MVWRIKAFGVKKEESKLSLYKFHNLTLKNCSVDDVANFLKKDAENHAKSPSSIHLVNSFTCTLFAKENDNNPLLDERAINLIDGFWLAAYLNRKYTTKNIKALRGPSLMQELFELGHLNQFRHAFVGSSTETLSKLRQYLTSVNPVFGESLFISPPYAELNLDYLTDLTSELLRNRIDVVWLGMGTPKQDFMAQQFTNEASINTICVGAAFDFLAGQKKQAPLLLRKIGLEWFFRLTSEPKRLWKRYLFGNLLFIKLCAEDSITKNS